MLIQYSCIFFVIILINNYVVNQNNDSDIKLYLKSVEARYLNDKIYELQIKSENPDNKKYTELMISYYQQRFKELRIQSPVTIN